MRSIIVLVSVMIIWVMTPALAEAKDRDRHDRHYGKERDHYVYKVEKHRDHRQADYRHGKEWKKPRHGKHDKHWRKHHNRNHVVYRPHSRRVVYRSVPTVVYREPVIYYPSSYVTIGVPNVSLRFTW